MFLKRLFSSFLSALLLVMSVPVWGQSDEQTRKLNENLNRSLQESIERATRKQSEDTQRMFDESMDKLGQRICELKIPLIDFDLIELGESDKMDVNKCWQNKPILDSESGERKKFENALEICSCLKNSPNHNIRNMMSEAYQDQKQAMSNSENGRALEVVIEENKGRLAAQLDEKAKSMSFQMSVLAPKEDNLANSYGIIRGPSQQITTILNDIETKTKETSTSAQSDDQIKRQTIRNAVTSAVRNINDQKSLPFRDSVFKSEEGAIQCVGAREFFAFKQLPSDPLLYQSLISENFDEKAWDYDELKKEFERLTSYGLREKENNRDKILTLKAKILFLSRNPLIKNMFAVKKSTEEYEKSISPADYNKVKEASSQINISSKKAELFNIMKSMIPKDSLCTAQGNYACLQNAFKEGLSEKYNKNLLQFFSNAAISELVKAQGETDILNTIKDFAANKMLRDASNLNDAKTYRELEEIFSREKKKSLRDCDADKDATKCVDIYGSFCPMMTQVSQNRARENLKNDDLINDLDALIEDNFQTDIRQNEEFRELNDEICSNQRQTRFLNKGRVTFFDFKENFCKGNKTQRVVQLCGNSPESNALLRNEYLRKYPDLTSSSRMAGMISCFASAPIVGQMSESAARNVVSQRGVSIADTGSMIRQANEAAGRPNFTPGGTTRPVATSIVSTGSSSDRASSSSRLFSSSPSFDDSFQPGMIAPSTIGAQRSIASLPTPDEKITEEDKERIRSMAEEEIARSRRETSSMHSGEKAILEARMKALEELLAQKNETDAKYREIIEKLSQRMDHNNSPAAQSALAQGAADAQTRRASSNNSASGFVAEEMDQQVNRSPAGASASDAQKFATSGSASGEGARVASAFGGSAAAAAKGSSLSGANGALLDAAIARGKASGDGSAIIVSEADRGTVTAIENATVSGPQFSLSVPASAFVQFQSENVEVLRQYKDQILKNIGEDQVARLTVKNGDKTMNIVVVNRKGNLVYMPSRVFSLKGLNQELQSTRAPARSP